MATHNALGNTGERKAAEYLTQQGYTIINKNWRNGKTEVDLIAWSPDKMLVFVEVKTRSSKAFGAPHEFVNQKKESRLISAAEVYVSQNTIPDNCEIRFDIIGILSLPDENKIYHFKDAFRDVP